MTNEEAITELSVLWERFNNGMGWRDGQYEEALDMAIEALSAEPTDLIRRADAIAKAKYLVNRWIGVTGKAYEEKVPLIEEVFNAIPSAEAEPTVIRSRTLMPTEDFKEWARRIKEDNSDVIVIPCDAEVASANPTELLQDGTLKVNVKSEADVKRVLVWGDDGSGGLYYADDSDDEVKVVRCKDCKYVGSFMGELYCELFPEDADRKANDYCSYGERRTE